MANYPGFDQLVGSFADPQSGIRSDRASNGDIHGQTLYSSDRKIFTVLHLLDNTDKGTLDTFYTTNKALEISFTWEGDSVAYNCIFMDAPKFKPRGASLFDVVVALAEKDV